MSFRLHRIFVGLLAAATIAVPALAQPFPTATNLFPSPGSQANTPAATFTLNAVVTSPGEAPSPPLQVLSANSVSTTLNYTSFGSTTFPAPGSIALTGGLGGTPNAAFALALSIQPGSTFCGGFAGWPCMTGPLLLGTVTTNFGLYHLDASPIMILDGITQSAPPAALDGTGNFALAATGVVDTNTNGGVEMGFAVQAAIVDPAAPAGIRLTACATVSQWVFYL